MIYVTFPQASALPSPTLPHGDVIDPPLSPVASHGPGQGALEDMDLCVLSFFNDVSCFSKVFGITLRQDKTSS